MSSEDEVLSVEEQVFEAFFQRLDDDSDLIAALPEEIRRLHDLGELIDSSAVAETILESSRAGDEPNAS